MGRLRRANASRSMHHPGWLCQRDAFRAPSLPVPWKTGIPTTPGLRDLPFVRPLWLPFPPYLRLACALRPQLTDRCAARLASGIA
jgi:hypothetical protein